MRKKTRQTSTVENPHIIVYVVASKLSWGAVAVYHGLRSLAWTTEGMIAGDTSPENRELLGVIGALRRLLRPTPGLPPSKRLNIIVYSATPEVTSDIKKLTNAPSPEQSELSLVVASLEKKFRMLDFQDSRIDSRNYWPEAHQEAESIASHVKIRRQNCFQYHPNLCMTANVIVKDSKSRRWNMREITVTHDLGTAGRKGVSLIDSSYAEMICPGILSRLTDPGELYLLTGSVNMNILGMYPGSIDISLQENENISLRCAHIQRLEGVLVVHNFHVPLYVSLNAQSIEAKTKCAFNMAIDTFKGNRFGPRYMKHKFWTSVDA